MKQFVDLTNTAINASILLDRVERGIDRGDHLDQAVEELSKSVQGVQRTAQVIGEDPYLAAAEITLSAEEMARAAAKGDTRAIAEVTAFGTQAGVDIAIGSKGLNSTRRAAGLLRDGLEPSAETAFRSADDFPRLQRSGGFSGGEVGSGGSGSLGGGVGPWRKVNERSDPRVVEQLHGSSCGPACAAMLLRDQGVVAFQSSLAVRQGSVLTSSAPRLAGAMNQLSGVQRWYGAFIDVADDPEGVFKLVGDKGPFATSLRVPGMRVSHMVVVDGIDDAGLVRIRDPLGSEYGMQWEDFVEVWEGQTVFEEVKR